MSIKIKGSTDGSVSLDAPADTSPTGSDITLTLPTTVGSAEQFLKNSGTAGELEFSSMVETSTGVGIGETSPLGKCHIKTGDSGASSVGASADELVIEGSANAGMTIISGTSGQGLINFADSGDVNVGNITYDHNANFLSFKTNDAERLKIDNSGIVFLGSSSSTSNTIANNYTSAKMSLSGGGGGCAVIDIYGAFHSTSPKEIRMSTNSVERFKMNSSGHSQFRAASYVVEARSIAGSSASNCLYSGAHSSTGFGLGTITYEVYTNGNVKNTNNSYGQLSDVNLKENIVDATSQWDDIKSLQIRKYNFREATGYETHTQIGLVAQEVETVCPGLVQTTPVREDATPVLDAEGNALETIKSVSTSVLYMKAVKALQEAMTRIETLETQNTAQQAQIDDLLTRVTALEAAE
jgi:hypothetical protein